MIIIALLIISISTVQAATPIVNYSNKMSPLESIEYTESQMIEAFASLVSGDEGLKKECGHFHGFNDVAHDGSLFQPDHKLSMLQTITARRVLDYKNLLVS